MQSEKFKVLKKVAKYNIFDLVIGNGSSGKVYLGASIESNKLVAVKIFDKSKLYSVHKIIKEQTTKSIQREANIHKQLNHQNIVKLYDVFETKNSIYFFLEYCQQNLEEFLKKQQTLLGEIKVKEVFVQILNSFLYLQNAEIKVEQDLELTFGADQLQQGHKGLCHRDLKPSNILLFNNQVKLADFGICRDLVTSNQSIGLGTPLYMSPLSLLGKESNDLSKNDVWSAGVILFEMLYRQYPWKKPINQVQLTQTITNDALMIPDLPKYSKDVKDLIRGMLAVDEDKRFSWDQISKHDWIVKPVCEDNSLLLIKDAFSNLDIADEKV